MTPAEYYFGLAASAVFLGLALITATRGATRSALGLPTALLCADLFAYNSIEILGHFAVGPAWEGAESAAAALAVPLLYHLTLCFLGARQRERAGLVAAYAYFSGIAVSGLLPIAIPAWRGYAGGDLWALLVLGGMAPPFARVLWLFRRHYRENLDPDERAKTQLFLVTVAILVGGTASDLASIAGAPAVPRLAPGGMLLSAILLTAIALRAKVVSGALSTIVVTAVLVGVFGVASQFLVFRWFGGTPAALAVGTAVVTLLLLVSARFIWSTYAEVRERTEQLATLGRLSAQMAHDIRNPLAAIQGAAQYIAEERKRGGTLEDQREFLDLILEQVGRLDRVVSDYRRLGRTEPAFQNTDLDELLEKVVEGAGLSPKAEEAGVRVRCDTTSIGCYSIDPELVRTALENLVRNAIEALEEGGGSIVIEAEAHEDELTIRVTDDGPGMDARTREQAERAFFTTKAQGSGLGLAFARRVAEAHGGRTRVRSALGRGTTVELSLRRPKLR